MSDTEILFEVQRSLGRIDLPVIREFSMQAIPGGPDNSFGVKRTSWRMGGLFEPVRRSIHGL